MNIKEKARNFAIQAHLLAHQGQEKLQLLMFYMIFLKKETLK